MPAGRADASVKARTPASARTGSVRTSSARTESLRTSSVRTGSVRGQFWERSSLVGSAGSDSALPALSPVLLAEPPPGRALGRPRVSPSADLSVLELPLLVAKVGPQVAAGESVWSEGPGLVAAALGADIPLRAAKPPQLVSTGSAEQDVPVQKHMETDGTRIKPERRTKRGPLSGVEVFEMLVKKRNSDELQFFYLKSAEDGPYRPYDLQVVPRSKAGSDHHVFSAAAALQVQGGHSAELVTPAEWYREAVLWSALREIPFFRLFLLQKAFTRWRRGVCRVVFGHRRKLLESRLLMAVPQFREALLHFSRLLEELKSVQWLPKDKSRTFTLQEFQTSLLNITQESQSSLLRFLQYRSLILTTVQESCYKAQQELQCQEEHSQVRQPRQPLHQQPALTLRLDTELTRAQHALHRLGNITALIDHMTIQSLTTITQQETTSFLTKLLQRDPARQGGLFQAKLVLGEDGQITVVPPVHSFQQVLSEALLSVRDSILQVFDFSSAEDSSIASLLLTNQHPSSSTDLPSNMIRPISRASRDRGSTHACPDSLSSLKKLRGPSASDLLLPTLPSLRAEGKQVQGQCQPLSREQLEWHLQLHAGTQEIHTRQTSTITQEAVQEVQQWCERCSWLMDTLQFAKQWSTASAESMRGWPAPQYRQLIQQAQHWRERVGTMPAGFTTTNHLLTITSSHIQQQLGSVLTSIWQDAVTALCDELQQRSENLTSDLSQAVQRLESQPSTFRDFTRHAGMVNLYRERSADLKQQLDSLYCLQEITTQLPHSDMTPGDHPSIEQTLNLWNQFVLLLEQAADTVTKQLPTLMTTLDSTFSSLTTELQDLVHRATTGPYTDPTQSAGPITAELRVMCTQLNVIEAQLDELSSASQTLTGNPLDLISVRKAKQAVEVRKEMWDLISASTAQIQRWRPQQFSKFIVARAQEKVSKWLQQAASFSSVIPAQDLVLLEAKQNLDQFSQQLSVLAQLSSPTLKPTHWRNICAELDLLYSPELNFTVADLLSTELLKHEGEIRKICKEAAAQLEQAFRSIQQSWERREFQLKRFIFTVWRSEDPQLAETPQKKTTSDSNFTHNAPQLHTCDSRTFTITGLDTLLYHAEDSIMTLSCMLRSRYALQFRTEVELWLQVLQELEELLDICERYQQKWIFLSKIFNQTSERTPKQLMEKFSLVDKTFREIIQITLSDPHVLNFVRLWKTTETCGQFQGQNLRILFTEGLTVLEEVCSELMDLVDSVRGEFPRLQFLSDGEVMKILSLHPTPLSLLPLVRKCFRGVQGLEVTNSSGNDLMSQTDSNEYVLSRPAMRVQGVYGALQEHLPFLCPLEPPVDPLIWLGLLENRLYETVKQLMHRRIFARQCQKKLEQNGVPSPEASELPAFWQQASEYPVQCCLVAEEVLWCSEVEKAFQDPDQSIRKSLKSRNAAKLKSLCQAMQAIFANLCDGTLATKHALTALRALILLTMKHYQQIDGLAEVKGSLESSFKWQRTMTYRHSATDNWNQSGLSQEDLCCTEHSVYVNILGMQLPYGYEYIGPENWMAVNTSSTERAFLVILFALSSYRCAYISGPSMSGKKETLLQLGWALGRQVVTLRICASTSLPLVCQMLIGALQTGAWLVLDSVESMDQGSLSVLGQHLTDLHQHLSIVPKQQKVQELQDLNDLALPERKPWCQKTAEMECQVPFAGSNISVKPSFGCVLISSNGYSAEIPENLRVVTRPVSLMHPDYSIITEVLLVSLGFSEAASLSRRLVSLFSLAKDLFCLPDYVCRDQTSWLVLLKRVIHASGLYLYNYFEKNKVGRFVQHVQDGQRSDDDPALRCQGSDKIPQGSEDRCSGHYQCFGRDSVVNAVREEQYVVRAVAVVVLPAITEPSRASQFKDIFEEIFPTGRSFTILQKYVKEREQDVLRNAVSEELQETGLWPDSPMLDSALTLYETLELSKVVMLLGPAGSGKTTLYQALAGALRRLAEKSSKSELDEEDDLADKTKTKVPSGSRWYSINTVVLFPNALPHEELFGRCYRHPGCWCDGAITKVIRTSGERDSLVNDLSRAKDRKAKKPNVQWLVLDGEPSDHPGWFYSLRTLGDLRDPCLCLLSSEKVQPSQELKIIIENTSLRDAAPSTLAQCSLVHVSGQDLWKSIWKNELDTLYQDDALDRNTLKMWKSAADDLFSRTLTFIKHHSLTTVLSGEGDEGIIDGLREITSFINILHALLEEFDEGCGLKSSTKSTQKGDFCHDPIFTQLQARNLFVIAYVWGFGGHLHPRHWPKFDLLAREALFESRYKIEVSAEDTVFDHFFNLRDREMDDATSLASFTRNPQHSYTPVPQYEKHAYLLDRVLDAGRPALLVGESASGKTSLCRFLSQRRTSLNFSVSPPLQAANLRYILERVARHQAGLHPAGTIAQHPPLLLFVDDLHEAPSDNNGKSSMVLEMLRQCISQGGVWMSHGYHFRSFSSGALNYLAAHSTFGIDGRNPSTISPRFSRFFTLFVLPDVTPEVLFSVHSSQLLPWLRRFPSMPAVSDLARCIVSATFDVYAAVREHLYDSTDVHSPYTWFSLHDLQKVFQGMCLWYPMNSAGHLLTRKSSISSWTLPAFTQADLRPAATVLNIAQLWMHECLRTFGDRLSSDEEIQNLVSVLTQVSEKRYGRRLVEIESQTSKADKLDSTGQLKDINEDHQNQLFQQSQLSQPSQQSQWSTETKNIEESVASKESSIEEVKKCHLESSGEQRASNSRSSKIDSEEDDPSVGSSSKQSKSETSGCSIADDQPKSVLNESAPQDFTLSKSALSESALNLMDNSSSDEAKPLDSDSKLNQCDLPTCEDHSQDQDHSRLLLKLLLEMGSTIGSAVYSPDFRKPVDWIAQKQQHSYQERDLDMLIQQLNQIVNQKQETHFAIYPKRVHHLVRILRALLLPGGHGVILAAGRKTGRKTTVRLAARLAGHRLIEIHHGNEAKLSEILRETKSQTGVNGGPAVVLVHEDVSQAVRDKLMVVMANKAVVPDVPEDVYLDEFIKDVMLNITAMKNSSKPGKSGQIFKRRFKNRRRNLHIFLLLSFNEGQPGPSPVAVPHMTRLFSLCSCVDVYQPWSSVILTQIASQHLQQHLQNLPSDIHAGEGVVYSLAEVMAGVHLSALHCASTSLNVQPFGPKNYFELMRHFHHLYAHLTEQGRVPTTRLGSVLARVRGVTESAQKLREELLTLQARYDQTQEVVKQLQESADAERVQCEEVSRRRLLAEAELWDLEEQLEQVEQQIRRSMSEAGPLYQAALNALRSLNQSDLEEVRSYRQPPAGVVTLMNAVCMLFHQPCSWENSKLLLGQSEFIQELEFFDRSSLSNEVFDKLGEVVRSAELQPESVRAVSRACESVSCWLQAVYQCAVVQRLMVPLEAQKSRLWKSAAERRARLREARMQEEAAQDQLEVTERQQRMVRTSLDQLAEQIREVQAREKEAVAAVHQISYYTEKWSSLQQETEMNKRTIPGDALLLAAAIVYLGPFGPDARLDLLEKWHRMCLTGGRNAGPDHPPGSLPDGAQCGSAQNPGFVPVPVGAELYRVLARAVGVDDDDGLSKEDSSRLVLELLRWGNRVPWAQNWTLLAGPRQREELCSPMVLLPGDEDEYELVVSADDPEFLKKLRHGAETGVRVLITDTECADPSEEFLQLLHRYSSNAEHSETSPRSGFHLVLSSSLPVLVLLEEIHPSVLEKIKVIDLSLSTSETQETILTNILQSECPDVWTRHCQLKTDQQALQKQLHLQEASLMEYIFKTPTPLLQDSSPGFDPWVSKCLDSLQKLRAENEELSNDINQHRSVISQFHGVATLITRIYTSLQDVGRLSPFYCFPLDRFLLVLRDALAQMSRLGGTYSGEEITEMSHRIVAHYLAHYRPCLSQCHAEVLKLQVSTTFFTHSEGHATEMERTAFLLGIGHAVSPEPTPSLDNPEPELPSWVPEHVRADVRLLEKMSPFRGLCSSLRNSSRQWQQYLRFPSSTVVGPVPCETHSHLTVLQRAILWRTFFPQCLATVANDLTTCQQGEPWSSAVGSGSHTGSLKQLLQFLSRNKGPVIITLPDQSTAECRGVHPLYWITELAHVQEKHGNRVKVKVITFGSESQRGAVLSELDHAVRTGHWLVLNNCHLLDHWDDGVVARLRRLMSSRSEDPETSEQDGPAGGRAVDKVHPRFRLWFITKGSAAFSVPAVVRVCALHLVCDSDQDLRDELCSSLRRVLHRTFTNSSSGLSMTAAEPRIRCAILHSVLLQRQQLAQRAHGHLYHWTQEDLLALGDAQVHMTELCSDPTGAIEYIAANLIYGGHVSDWSDLEEVKAVCRLCLQPSPPTQGIGPHTLSESVTAAYFGEEDLMKVLERRVHSVLSSTGTSVLGFSAAVMAEMVKVKSLRLQALLLKSLHGSGGVSGPGISSHLQSLQDCRKSQDRLQALWNKLSCSEEGGGTGFGSIPAGPLSRFLRTELEQLMEQVSQYLSSSSYPTPSTVWALETRAELLRAYQWEESSGKHHVYCLSAFSNARGFLAALLRENARLRQQELSSISLHFQVLDPAASVPSSGICISGLELRGALWDNRLGVLQDSLSPNHCPLPLLWVRTLEQDLLKTSRPQVVFNCPLYLDVQDPGDDWSLTEEHIITHVPLRTRLDPVLCTLRRVRLVSTLSVNRFQN
ncbi:dynein heavy chain domain-containing protein 1 isoform X2 [Astyanax mexicanus]|uniref:dynein heavy chain domain-containing protein 1 isoform X2 n=1 Tax=Astyanax mexicanus TaxID=7994 RepID=UPI0020CB27A8|nr:dynein heavy chain domain-containing protein 1 isoform X2 [Astyanax mexicanus]